MTAGDRGLATSARGAAHDIPLVLIHGFLGGARQWSEVVNAFSNQRPVITIDLPGFADAAAEKPATTINEFSHYVLAELDARRLQSVAVLGHSMGGMIAQEMACQRPDLIDRLVLYGTGPLGQMPDRFESIERSLERLEQQGLSETARTVVASWFVDGRHSAGFESLEEIATQASPDAARKALLAMAAWDGRNNLAQIEVPTLVLWGDQDRSYRWPQVESLWQGLPRANLAVVPGASHATHVEKPGIFVPILQDFLAS
jgi:pimeloyl-ACP methyl ester carboxylesterase